MHLTLMMCNVVNGNKLVILDINLGIVSVKVWGFNFHRVYMACFLAYTYALALVIKMSFIVLILLSDKILY